MKKKLLILCFIIFIIGFLGKAGAATYTWQPTPADLWDLDHYKYYTWGEDWKKQTDEVFVGASLLFDNIRNWDRNTNDLYVTLLDSAATGVAVGTDNQGGGDYFVGQGILLNHWHWLSATPQDITYIFDTLELSFLSSYVVDDNFGLGFDPDCHYWNDGITLTIETRLNQVPEPATMLLLGTGLVGLAGFRRKFRKKVA